jgi:hypothetical protein
MATTYVLQVGPALSIKMFDCLENKNIFGLVNALRK